MGQSSKEYSLSTQAAYVFIGRVSASTLSFVVPIILVRIFTQEEYGLYQQALLISITLIEVLKWGLINSLFYFYPLAKEKISELLSQTFYLLVFIGSIFLPLLYLLRLVISDLFNSTVFISLIWPIGFYFFFMLTSLILNSLFVLEKKSKTVVIYEVANQLVRITIVLGTAIIFKDIYVVLWGLALFALLRSSVLYVYLKKNYKISYKKIEMSYLLSQIKYIFPIGGARLVKEIGSRIDKYILCGMFSPAQYAIYAVANFKIPFIGAFYGSVGNVLIPAMTIHGNNGELNKTKELWHKMIVKYATVTIPSVILFLLLAKHIIILLYTDKYIDSVNVFRIFLIIFFIQMINPSSVLRACRETKVIFKSHFYSMIVAVSLSYFLILHYGMIGGAISVVTSSYVRTLIQTKKVKELLSLDLAKLLPWFDVSKIMMCSLCGALLPFVIMQQNLPNLLTILLGCIAYSLIIVPIFIFANILNYRELVQVAKSISF